MGTTVDWSLLRPTLKLKIDGEDVACDDLAVAYELNTIPQATIGIPAGINLPTGIASPAGRLVRDGKRGASVEVYLRVESFYASGDSVVSNWQQAIDKDVLLFEGEAVAYAPNVSVDGAGLTLIARSWLGRLDEASVLSAGSHPGNPAAFTYNAAFRSNDLGLAGGARPLQDPSWVPMCSRVKSGVTRGVLEAGLWSKTLQPWLVELAGRDFIDSRLAGGGNAPKIQDALARLLPTTKYTPSTAMDFGAANGDAIASQVAQYLTTSSFHEWVSQTAWAKIINDWCAEFLLAVCPRPTDGFVMPFVGSLAGEPYKTISTAQGTHLQPQMSVPRLLRAVGIAHPVMFTAGGHTVNINQSSNALTQEGLAAVYPAKPEGDGLVVVRPSPRWLRDPVSSVHFGLSPGEPIASAMDVTPSPAEPPAAPPSNKPMLEKFAAQVFAAEGLRGRFGELTGPLRLDIAPGSTIGITGSDETSLLQKYVGLVTRVTVRIGTVPGRGRPGTSFSLAFLRTEAEHADSDLVLARPPLYKEAWRGAPLVDGME